MRQVHNQERGAWGTFFDTPVQDYDAHDARITWQGYSLNMVYPVRGKLMECTVLGPRRSAESGRFREGNPDPSENSQAGARGGRGQEGFGEVVGELAAWSATRKRPEGSVQGAIRREYRETPVPGNVCPK